MFRKGFVDRSILAGLIAAVVYFAPALSAYTDLDAERISELLTQAKKEVIQLKQDAEDMDSFTLSNMSWESHAAKIMEIKEHVNAAQEIVAQLNLAKNGGAPWQKIAIERVNPLMAELAMNTEATIYHLNKEKGRLLNTQEHKEYLKSNAELAAQIAAVVTDFVDYGETKAKFEKLSRKLEVSER